MVICNDGDKYLKLNKIYIVTGYLCHVFYAYFTIYAYLTGFSRSTWGFFPHFTFAVLCVYVSLFSSFLPLMVFETLFVISVSVSWEEKSSTDSMATLKPHTIMFFFLSFFLLLFLYISFNLNYGKPLRSTHFMLWNRILKSCFIQFAQVFRVFFSPSFIHLWSPGFSETMNELIGFYLNGFFRNSIDSNILVQRTIIAIYLRDSWEIPIKHLQRSSETFWNVI